jgi:hypothetical protein
MTDKTPTLVTFEERIAALPKHAPSAYVSQTGQPTVLVSDQGWLVVFDAVLAIAREAEATLTAERERADRVERARHDAEDKCALVSEWELSARLRAESAEAENARLRSALKELRIDANRLCDRNLGGTYEEDCRRSIAKADAALTPTAPTGDPHAE